MTEARMNERNDMGAVVKIASRYFHNIPEQAEREELISHVAEGWCVALRRLDSTRTKEEQTAFLFRSAEGWAKNFLRDRMARMSGEIVGMEDKAIDGNSRIATRDAVESGMARMFVGIQLDRVLQVVASLPEKQRSVIERRYLKGMTLDEVGQEDGITRERVRQIEAKALASLKKCFTPDEEV
jgi:RNA polymerase sigma factor (sigma-70 family)